MSKLDQSLHQTRRIIPSVTKHEREIFPRRRLACLGDGRVAREAEGGTSGPEGETGAEAYVSVSEGHRARQGVGGGGGGGRGGGRGWGLTVGRGVGREGTGGVLGQDEVAEKRAGKRLVDEKGMTTIERRGETG